jgi:signal peptidase I
MVKNNEVFVNNKQLTEPYIAAKTPLWDGGYVVDGVPVSVPDNSLFVMGDNRPRSSDSREFGPISMSSVVGHVFYRYYPAEKMGPIENPFPPTFQAFSSDFFARAFE